MTWHSEGARERVRTSKVSEYAMVSNGEMSHTKSDSWRVVVGPAKRDHLNEEGVDQQWVVTVNSDYRRMVVVGPTERDHRNKEWTETARFPLMTTKIQGGLLQGSPQREGV